MTMMPIIRKSAARAVTVTGAIAVVASLAGASNVARAMHGGGGGFHGGGGGFHGGGWGGGWHGGWGGGWHGGGHWGHGGGWGWGLAGLGAAAALSYPYYAYPYPVYGYGYAYPYPPIRLLTLTTPLHTRTTVLPTPKAAGMRRITPRTGQVFNRDMAARTSSTNTAACPRRAMVEFINSSGTAANPY